jgi:hypothetical protein
VAAIALGATNAVSSAPPAPVATVIFLMTLTFPLTGALLATKRPGNPIGWLFLVVGLGFTLSFACEEYAYRALVLQPELPAGIWAAWVSQWVFLLWLGPLPLVLLLFPDGRLPSPRWRPLPVVMLLWGSLWGLASALKPGPFDSDLLAEISNPFGVEWIPIVELEVLSTLIGVVFLLSAFAAISRFRRARALERQQLKLFAYAAGLMVVVLLALLLVPPAAGLLGMDPTGADNVLWILFIASFWAVALAVTLAILRYRLYDIDLLINRTVVYGATSATVAVTFFLGLVALQGALSRFTSGSELAVAASTLASFALVQPIRRRVQDAVDRRFDRSHYDASHALDEFAAQLREEVDLDALRSDLLGAVEQTMAPAHSSLWLRDRNDSRTAPV